jgi:chitodextrinase
MPTCRFVVLAGFFSVAFLACAQPATAQTLCPPPATGALTGCYYNNASLTGNPAFARTDSQINFNWGKGSPDPSLAPGNFSVRWAGTFAFTAGAWTFSATTSDGIRIYLDGTLLLDRWFDQPSTMYSASATVAAGNHIVTVEYYDYYALGTAQVSWKNNAPGASAPAISSFTATPSTVAAGQSSSLSWIVSGATSLNIDHGVGDVTGRGLVSVSPAATTAYTLTASNAAGSVTASATVTANAGSPLDTQPPSAPTLISATARNANEADLTWLASRDNTAVTGYTVFRNNSALTTLPATALTYADTTVKASNTYVYSMGAFDQAGNVSAMSNQISATTPGAQPPSGNCPAPATQAFMGCYYSNMTLSGNPVFVRTDPQINFYWGNSSPDATLPPLNFSARWQGNFQFVGGNYLFNAITSDGMRLYVDGILIIDRWRDQSPNQYRAAVTLSSGNHLVVVEYYEHLGGATAQVSWQDTAPPTSGPAISSFTATPTGDSPGQPVTLAWRVSGAIAAAIDQGIGDVSGWSSITIRPVVTTTYTLTASNASGSSSASATVTIGQGPGSPPATAPTAPVLTSATAISSNEVDLGWTLSTSPVGIAGYQILRNGIAAGNVLSSTNSLFYADTGLIPNATYFYTVKGYDPAGNYSAPSNSVSATTPAGGNVSATWYGACWETATLYGITGQFQAMDFALSTPTPVPVQGTLFFAADCDDRNGTDNMNDFNSLTPSTHTVQGFSHHPDEVPTSALYWIGSRTADGKCPAGAPCSRCVNYTKVTPKCESLP